jgi:hypothetical protein
MAVSKNRKKRKADGKRRGMAPLKIAAAYAGTSLHRAPVQSCFPLAIFRLGPAPMSAQVSRNAHP